MLVSAVGIVDDAACRRRGSLNDDLDDADDDDDDFFLPYVRTLSLIVARVSFRLRSVGVCDDGIFKREPYLLLSLSLSK